MFTVELFRGDVLAAVVGWVDGPRIRRVSMGDDTLLALAHLMEKSEAPAASPEGVVDGAPLVPLDGSAGLEIALSGVPAIGLRVDWATIRRPADKG